MQQLPDAAIPIRAVAAAPGEPRADLLLHALAQAPESVRLELDGHGPERAASEALAAAYAIEDRVSFGASEHPAIGFPGTLAELVEHLTEPGDPPSESRRADDRLAGHRVAIVTNVPAPYRIPLFNTMARRLEAVGSELRVYFQSLGSRSRPWIGSGGGIEFEHEVLRSFELPIGFRRPRMSIGLQRNLSRFDPSVVLCGSLSPIIAPSAASAARRVGAAFGLWSGEVAWRPTAAGARRRLVRRWVARHADFAVVYGFQAGEYLRSLRPDLPIAYGRNSSAAYAIGRDRPHHPEVVELLAVADLAVPGKGIGILIDALRDRPALRCRLTVVGGQGAAAEAARERAAGDERIRLLGAMPQGGVQRCYAESDVYLFPSQIDIFGLAMVEAMGSGLAPVTSTRPGVASDLAVHEHNSLTVDRHDRAAWAQAIERIVLDHELRSRLGDAARQTIERRWTIEHACEGMFAAFRLGLQAKGQNR